jgi:hypothetical protein
VTSAEGLATPHRSVGGAAADYDGMSGPAIEAAQERACLLLRELLPTAHVLIVTRGYASMMLSAYSQYVRTGGTRSFAEICLDTTSFPDGHPWDYDRVIGLYERAFAPERVLLLPYELLRDRPDAFVAAIEAHLGLDHSPAPAMRVNAAVERAALAWYPRFARLTARHPRLHRRYAALAAAGRLAPLARLLQRLFPLRIPELADIPPQTLLGCRGRAERLRRSPAHRPYLSLYLPSEE